MTTSREKIMLREVKRRLEPPTDDELNRAMARWLFGKHADKMLEHAPWSFILLKLMWKKGEEPWAN